MRTTEETVSGMNAPGCVRTLDATIESWSADRTNDARHGSRSALARSFLESPPRMPPIACSTEGPCAPWAVERLLGKGRRGVYVIEDRPV